MNSSFLALRIVQWEKMPRFMQEGIEGFPFENRADAQMFSDLLVLRTRSLLTCAPNLEDREEDIVNFIDMFEAEMVSKACPGCFSGPDTALDSWLVRGLPANAICQTSGSSTRLFTSRFH